jgi:hypothetical protein
MDKDNENIIDRTPWTSWPNCIQTAIEFLAFACFLLTFHILYIVHNCSLVLAARLIDYLLFYVPLKNISLIWRRHHCRWRAAKFRPMLGAHGLWAGRDLYRATPTVTRDTGPRFFRSHPKDHPNQSPLVTTHEGMRRTNSNPDPHGGWRLEDIDIRLNFPILRNILNIRKKNYYPRWKNINLRVFFSNQLIEERAYLTSQYHVTRYLINGLLL